MSVNANQEMTNPMDLNDTASRPVDSLMRWIVGMLTVFTVAAFAMTVVGVVTLPHHLNPDVGVNISTGVRLIEGERLYVDYEEINFPMIHWLNVLPAAVSRLTGLAPTIAFQAWMLVLIGVSSALLWRLFPRQRLIVTVLIFSHVAVSWMLLIILQWGQREHLFTLLYLPFLTLRVLRREGESPAAGLALTIGILAGVGVAIKPYFALTAVLVEVVGVLASRRWFIRTPEVMGVGLVAGLHVAYFAFNPDVLHAFVVMIGRLSDGYGAYIPAPYSEQVRTLMMHGLISALPFGLLLLRYRFLLMLKPLVFAMSIFSIGSMVGFVLQGKGWAYHSIPMTVASTVIVLALAAELMAAYVRENGQRLRFVQMMVLGLSVGGTLLIVSFGVQSIPNTRKAADDILLFHFNPYVERYTQPYERVMFIDTAPGPAYPMLPALNRRSASRYAVAQPFPIAYYRYLGAHYTDPAHVVPPYMQVYLDHLAEDLRQHQPSLLILRSDACAACRGEYRNLYDYLDVRGILAEVIEPDYDLLAVDSGFHVYLRKGTARNP